MDSYNYYPDFSGANPNINYTDYSGPYSDPYSGYTGYDTGGSDLGSGAYDPRLDTGVPVRGAQYGGGGSAGSAGGNGINWGQVAGAVAPIAGQIYAGSQQRSAGNANLNAANNMQNLMTSNWHEASQYGRPDQHSPWGSNTWDQDPKTGKWTQTMSLDPKDQANLESARTLSGSRLGAANSIDLSYLGKQTDWGAIDPGLGRIAAAVGVGPASGATSPGSMGGSFLTSGLYRSPAREQDYR
jgi:hypothetical protein